jgi:hypothetical protein
LTLGETRGDRVFMRYQTKVAMGRLSQRFVDRKRVDTTSIELCYDYPYQWSNTGNKIKHWCFPLPIDARTTRVFFLFYFESLKIPFLPWRIPRALMTLVLRIANRVLIAPLIGRTGSRSRPSSARGRPTTMRRPRAEPGHRPVPPAHRPEMGGALWRNAGGAAS